MIVELCSVSDQAIVGTFRQRFAFMGERWVQANEALQAVQRLQDREASLAGAAAEIEALTGTADRLERTLEANMAASNAAVADLSAQVGTLQDGMATLKAEQRATRDAAAQANRKAADARHQLAAREAELAERDATLAALRAELTALNHAHQNVIESPAWRATSPLRMFGQRYPGVSRRVIGVAATGAAALKGELPARLRLRRQVRADAETLATSKLFDRDSYLNRYPDVARSGADPLWHYIWSGCRAGYNPHPLFDSAFYLRRYPEIVASGVNPLAHYLREGAAAGNNPHPLFDTHHYRGQLTTTPANALLHYLETGAVQSISPNPLFDLGLYWNEYLRDHEISLDPLTHYILHGSTLGNDPHPHFDTDWYAARHTVPAGTTPLEHFLETGRALGYAPCLLFEHLSGAIPPIAFATAPAPRGLNHRSGLWPLR